MFNKFFFFENRAFYDINKKYCTTGQTTDDNKILRMRIAC
jgi:hypothetical protein